MERVKGIKSLVTVEELYFSIWFGLTYRQYADDLNQNGFPNELH